MHVVQTYLQAEHPYTEKTGREIPGTGRGSLSIIGGHRGEEEEANINQNEGF